MQIDSGNPRTNGIDGTTGTVETLSNADSINSVQEDVALTELLNASMGKGTKIKAKRMLKKVQKETERLKKHAGICLITGNKDGYIYAISKLRTFINKEVSNDVLESLWKTSREQIEGMMKNEVHTKEHKT